MSCGDYNWIYLFGQRKFWSPFLQFILFNTADRKLRYSMMGVELGTSVSEATNCATTAAIAQTVLDLWEVPLRTHGGVGQVNSLVLRGPKFGTCLNLKYFSVSLSMKTILINEKVERVWRGISKKLTIPGIFFVFSSFSNANFYRIKTAGFSGIRTGIVGVEGEHADHLTTTTAHWPDFLAQLYSFYNDRSLNCCVWL